MLPIFVCVDEVPALRAICFRGSPLLIVVWRHRVGIIEILGLAGSLSLLSGWRLYLTVFATGVAMHFNVVPLPENLAILDVLANPWVIGVSALGAIAEFFADKVAWLDSIWDGLHTIIRPVGGALRSHQHLA